MSRPSQSVKRSTALAGGVHSLGINVRNVERSPGKAGAAVQSRGSCRPVVRSLGWWMSRCCTSRTARAGEKHVFTSKRSPGNAQTLWSTTRSSRATKPRDSTDSAARRASTSTAATSSPTLTHQSDSPVASTKHLTDLPARQRSSNSVSHSARSHDAAQPPARAPRQGIIRR